MNRAPDDGQGGPQRAPGPGSAASPRILPQCLTIAGSDSGGGAGIQADLKAFQANGVFGMSVLTSITAQNTRLVSRAFDLPPDLITAQLQAVFDDFEVAAAKTGMLSSREIVSTVCSFWRSRPSAPPLVVDPVMISKSGYSLLARDAVERLREELLPLAALVTPNRYEAELLADRKIRSREDVREAGRRILDLGPAAVLIKGGHLDLAGWDPSLAVDTLVLREGITEYASSRWETSSTHGTGCTYSAAICARMGRGEPLAQAVAGAKAYVSEAIRRGLAIGRGHGPLDHFYFLRDEGGGEPAA